MAQYNFENLKLLSFNVEGLDSMLCDPSFLTLIEAHDICFLLETMKRDDSKLNLDGFWDHSLVRKKCKKAGRYSGGITVLVKSHLRGGVKVVHSTEGFLWIRLSKTFFHLPRDLYMCGGYIPPYNTSKEILAKTDYFHEFLKLTNQFMELGNVVITGDLNSRIGCTDNPTPSSANIPILEDIIPSFCSSPPLPVRSSCDRTINQYGRRLGRMCGDLDLCVINGRVPGDLFGNFTCFTPRGRSIVDLLMTDHSFFRNIQSMRVLPPEFASVHCPLSAVIRCPFEHTQQQSDTVPLKPKLIWDPSKRSVLREALLAPPSAVLMRNLISSISGANSDNSDLDKCVYEFGDLLVSRAKLCMKTSGGGTKKRPRKARRGFEWYNRECSSAKRRLQNLARLLSKNPSEPYLLGKYNTTKKHYRKTVKLAKRSFEVDMIKSLEEKASNPKEFWAFLKNLGRGDSTPASPSADEWVKHFSSLNANNPSADPRVAEFISLLQKRLETSSQESDALTAVFNDEEIAGGIKTLLDGKAVATDLISNEILKATSDIISPFLVALFNKILELETFPEDWSLGLILPLFKSGDALDVNCYRGITIISCLSKLFMLLMNNRLQLFCDKHNIIHYNQIGFRKHFRPSDHVLTVKTLIDQSIRNGGQLHVCFVDFRKAYDTVWRDGLYHKLLSYGVHPKFVRLLRNIYGNSSLAVRSQGGRSTIFPSNVGLKQGCNLSPLLFNLFVNDLLTEINVSFPHSPHLQGIPINGLMYADDLVLISETEEGLQKLLDILHNFTESWFLQVNKSKTKCMHFSRTKFSPKLQMKFGSDLLDSTDSYCYLGTTFTKNGSLNEAGSVLHDKAIKAMYGLIRKVNKHRTCTPATMFQLFEKMILPVALYNSEVWGTMCFPVNPKNNDFFGVSSKKNPVEDVQIKFCKRTLGVRDYATNWAVLTECGRLPTMTHVIRRMISFWYHVSSSPSPILRAALESNVSLSSMGVRSWFSYVERCLKFLKLEHIIYTSDPNEVRLQVGRVKKLVNQLAMRHWTETQRKVTAVGSKLDLFCKIKPSFGIPPYLSTSMSSNLKSAISKFRTSSHNLPVETLRYLGLQRSHRMCPFCSTGVGNEIHYLTECDYPYFLDLRSKFYASVRDVYPNLENFDRTDQVVSLLSSNNPKVLSKVGTFASAIMKYFKESNTVVHP